MHRVLLQLDLLHILLKKIKKLQINTRRSALIFHTSDYCVNGNCSDLMLRKMMRNRKNTVGNKTVQPDSKALIYLVFHRIFEHLGTRNRVDGPLKRSTADAWQNYRLSSARC